MDHKFTEQIKQWLETPEAERHYTVGALYLLKLSGNQIMYRNIISQIDRRHDFVKYQLQKYLNFRLQALTHEQVQQMEKEVEQIVAEHIPLAATAADNPAKGKRTDHDLLPDEIKAKYVANLSLLQRMRELHLRALRSLSLDNATCPDSERYPFLKELISLDKKLHSNWEAYDHYVAPGPVIDEVALQSRRSVRSLAIGKSIIGFAAWLCQETLRRR